ncbi:uncharacterized protein BN679_02186 [Prevotella sp. CAG:487]|nr:uncharacterized protein BN679_02186 [Prevotella sp. CAG:487]
MMQSRELAVILAFLSPLVEFCADHFRNEFLCLDKRNLNVSVRIAVERELTCDTFRQSLECRLIGFTQMRKYVFTLCILIQILIILSVCGEQVVEFLYQTADCRNKLDKSLRNENHTEVVALACTVSHCRRNLLDNVIKRKILSLYLLRYKADVRLCLQCAFKSDM